MRTRTQPAAPRRGRGCRSSARPASGRTGAVSPGTGGTAGGLPLPPRPGPHGRPHPGRAATNVRGRSPRPGRSARRKSCPPTQLRRSKRCGKSTAGTAAWRMIRVIFVDGGASVRRSDVPGVWCSPELGTAASSASAPSAVNETTTPSGPHSACSAAPGCSCSSGRAHQARPADPLQRR